MAASVVKKPFARLPTSVKPINYRLNFRPDLTNFTFDGLAEIEVSIVEATDKITLNSADLNITKASFQPSANGKNLSGQILVDAEEELATFSFGEVLSVGSGILTLEFNGILNDQGKGFYRTKYATPSGEERYALATQFEATDARRAFPCWDEPAIKATFDVTLAAPKDRTVLSNMPVKSEKTEGHLLKIVDFERTPIMSTYLLALVIGDFDHVETKDTNGVLIRIFTPVGRKEQGHFALSVVKNALPFYKSYFNIGYPLPKMDLICVPNKQGAMENWGLVTFTEHVLLVDAMQSSAGGMQLVALVVCHELAHQWFGNLVTMEWWTHLWLNEGYATWISYLCVDHLFPEWDIWSRFMSTDYANGIKLDSLKNSHAVESPIDHPSEIEEIFDAISYCKGAAIIRMIYDFIGDDTFRKGMNIYLTRHQYKNTETGDLWKALGEASAKDIGGIMSVFTGQVGYPVLSVELRDGAFYLKQQKYNADAAALDDAIWPIPVTVISENEAKSNRRGAAFSFDKQEGPVDCGIIAPKQDDWTKFNVGTAGFYRVHYSPGLLAKLSRGISEGSLSKPVDRLGLTADQFALCFAGYGVTIPQVLEFFENFKNETSFPVWEDISNSHTAVETLMQYTPHTDSFKAYTRRLYLNAAERLGWDAKLNESSNDVLLRSLVLSKMGLAGHAHTICEALSRFNDHVANKSQLSGDLRATVYKIVAKYGNELTYQQLYQLYQETDLKEEKIRLLQALGQFDDTALKRKFLEWCLTEEVTPNDVGTCFAAATNTPDGRIMVWNFVKSNWELLRKRHEATPFQFGRILGAFANSFHDEFFADDFDAFFAANPVPSAKRVAIQTSERSRIQAAWLRREQLELLKYFG